METWKKDDYLTYLYIYVADSDLVINDDEKDFILSRVSKELFDKVMKTYYKHKDIDKYNVISVFFKENYKTKADKEKIIDEIKNLYWADNVFNAIEKAYFISLKRLIHSI